MKDVDKEPQDYVARKLVDHYEDSDETVYKVRWFGNSADEDIWGPSENIPPHCVARYWKRRKNATVAHSRQDGNAKGNEPEETN